MQSRVNKASGHIMLGEVGESASELEEKGAITWCAMRYWKEALDEFLR
jgi:hypothetical protein